MEHIRLEELPDEPVTLDDLNNRAYDIRESIEELMGHISHLSERIEGVRESFVILAEGLKVMLETQDLHSKLLTKIADGIVNDSEVSS